MSVSNKNEWKPASLDAMRQIATAEKDWASLLTQKNKYRKFLKKLFFWRKPKTEFDGVAFPVVRRVFANLSANDIVGVQPMAAPNGLYLNYITFEFKLEKPIKHKILGKTPEEYLINLIHAWNSLPEHFVKEDIVYYYHYKIEALVKVYPTILYEYEIDDYTKNLRIVLEGHQFKYKFDGYKPIPQFLMGEKGYIPLWPTQSKLTETHEE